MHLNCTEKDNGWSCVKIIILYNIRNIFYVYIDIFFRVKRGLYMYFIRSGYRWYVYTHTLLLGFSVKKKKK